MESIHNIFKPYEAKESQWASQALLDMKDAIHEEGVISKCSFVALGVMTEIGSLFMTAVQLPITFAKSIYYIANLNLDEAARALFQGVKNYLYFTITSILLPFIVFISIFNSELFFNEELHLQTTSGINEEELLRSNRTLIHNLNRAKSEISQLKEQNEESSTQGTSGRSALQPELNHEEEQRPIVRNSELEVEILALCESREPASNSENNDIQREMNQILTRNEALIEENRRLQEDAERAQENRNEVPTVNENDELLRELGELRERNNQLSNENNNLRQLVNNNGPRDVSVIDLHREHDRNIENIRRDAERDLDNLREELSREHQSHIDRIEEEKQLELACLREESDQRIETLTREKAEIAEEAIRARNEKGKNHQPRLMNFLRQMFEGERPRQNFNFSLSKYQELVETVQT